MIWIRIQSIFIIQSKLCNVSIIFISVDVGDYSNDGGDNDDDDIDNSDDNDKDDDDDSDDEDDHDDNNDNQEELMSNAELFHLRNYLSFYLSTSFHSPSRTTISSNYNSTWQIRKWS